MADKKKDKFAEINATVDDTVNFCLGYILKFVYSLADTLEDNGGVGRIEEKKFYTENSNNGNLSIFQDIINLFNDAVDEYVRLYDNGLKKSKTWRTNPLLTKPQSGCQVKFKVHEIENTFNAIKLTDETANQSLKNITELCKILDTMFGAQNVSRLSNAKFYTAIKEVQSKLKNIKIDPIDGVEIESIDENVKIPNWIDNDGSVGGEEEDENKPSIFDKYKTIPEILSALIISEDGKKLAFKNEEDDEEPTELSEDDLEKLKNGLEKPENKKTVIEWRDKEESEKEKRGEKLKKIMEILKVADAGEEKEEETPVPPEIQEHIKTTGEEIADIISDIDSDNVEQQLEKIENMAKKTEEEMEKFMANTDDNGNEVAGKNSFNKEWNAAEDLLKDFADDAFAKIWQYHYLMSKKYESFNRFNQNMFLNFLMEIDENPANGEKPVEGGENTNASTEEEKPEGGDDEAAKKKEEFINGVKEDIQKLPKLFDIDSCEKFVESYKNFANSINEKIKTILNGENTSDETKQKLEELKDEKTFARAIKFYKIITAKEEEKPEETAKEGAEGEGENKENAVEPNGEKTGNNEPATDKNSFHASFQAALRKVL